jgi:hypothetical protein
MKVEKWVRDGQGHRPEVGPEVGPEPVPEPALEPALEPVAPTFGISIK